MAHRGKERSGPGSVLRALRAERGLTLRGLAEQVGLPYSTLSKLENGKMAMTYDKMVRLAQGMQVDIARLVATQDAMVALPAATGRRSVARGLGSPARRAHNYLAQDLLGKQMSPILIDVQARSVDELGGLFRHGGEEFLYVVCGAMDLHSELYAPLRLGAGDSVYFDSGMAHCYIKVGDEPCRVLSVCTGAGMEQLARAALTAQQREGE